MRTRDGDGRLHAHQLRKHLRTWNDRDPKYDIREWSPDGATMGKGVTLTVEELDALRMLLEQLATRD